MSGPPSPRFAWPSDDEAAFRLLWRISVSLPKPSQPELFHRFRLIHGFISILIWKSDAGTYTFQVYFLSLLFMR